MGTAARKQPFSDLSETDLDEYERRVRALRILADLYVRLKGSPSLNTR
jgi:hypothetical protein